MARKDKPELEAYLNKLTEPSQLDQQKQRLKESKLRNAAAKGISFNAERKRAKKRSAGDPLDGDPNDDC